METAKSSNSAQFVEILAKITARNTKHKLDDEDLTNIREWINTQGIKGTTLCDKIRGAENSFVNFAVLGSPEKPGLGSGTAMALYLALTESLKGFCSVQESTQNVC